MAKLEETRLNKIKPESFGDFDKVMNEFLPHFRLNSDQVPEIATWEPGKSYRIMIDMKQESKDINPSKQVNASFLIRAYKVIEEKPMEDMTDEEFGEYQGKELEKVEKSRESSRSE